MAPSLKSLIACGFVSIALIEAAVSTDYLWGQDTAKSGPPGTPEKAFAAYQQAIEKKDASAAFELLTAECQDAILFDAWAQEFERGGDKANEHLAKFLDEDKRRQLTREAVPTTSQELGPIFARSLSDKREAFATIAANLTRLRSNYAPNYRLVKVKIDGDKATADLNFKDHDTGPGDDTIRFEKSRNGWLLDIRPGDDFKKHKPKATLQPKVKPKVATKFATPQAAWTALQEGLRANDPSAVWNSMSARKRDDWMFVGRRQLIGDNGNNIVLYWYGDLPSFVEQDTKNPLPTAQENRARAFVHTIYDPETLFAAIVKRCGEIDELSPRVTYNDWKAVEVHGDRARGIFTVSFAAKADKPGVKKRAYEHTCYFVRENGGWIVDLPTAEEIAAAKTERIARQQEAMPESERKRLVVHKTPEKAYQAMQRAQKEFDYAALRDSMTPASMDDLIFSSWENQEHFQDAPPRLAEFIDEELRRKLTREQLPTKGHELPPLLIASLTNREAAIAAITSETWDKEELVDLKIEGDTATAKLRSVAHDGPRIEKPGENVRSLLTGEEISLPFVKDAQGWLVEMSPPRKPRPWKTAKRSEPWKHGPPPRYDSPEKVFEAYTNAWVENDPETLWNCLTERYRARLMQGSILGLVEGGGGDTIMAWYMDMTKLKSRSQGKDVEQIVHIFYDPEAYFSAIVKFECENKLNTDEKRKQKSSALKNVTIKGDRAEGTVTRSSWIEIGEVTSEGKKPQSFETFEYDSTHRFAKTDRGWLIDLPNEEENKRDAEKREAEAKKEREKSKAESK